MIRFQSSTELLARYQASLAYGGLFVSSRRLLEPEWPLILDIRMPEMRDALLIRGKVAWVRRARKPPGGRPGFGVEFAASETPKRDYLLAVARGQTPPASARRHKRLPIQLDGRWRVPRDTREHRCKIGEIGWGGAFLHTDTILPQGSPVVVELVPPRGHVTHSIEGRVAWTREAPGAAGFGVEFRCRDMVGKHRLRELVRRLEAHPV